MRFLQTELELWLFYLFIYFFLGEAGGGGGLVYFGASIQPSSSTELKREKFKFVQRTGWEKKKPGYLSMFALQVQEFIQLL